MGADDPQIIDDLGFKRADNDDDDSITGSPAIFYTFGRYGENQIIFPEMVTEEIALYKGSSYDAYKLLVASTDIQFVIPFIVLHGLSMYMMNCRKESSGGEEDGGIVDDGSLTFTGTPILDGETDPWVIRWHTSNGFEKIQKSITGNRFYGLTYSLDLLAPRSPLTASLIGKGMFMQPVVAGTESDYSLISPDSLDTPFYPDSRMVFTFNGIDLTDYVEFISLTEDTMNWLQRDKDNHQPVENTTSDRIYMMSFRIRRADEITVFDAYMDQSGAKGLSDNILNDMVWQIFNANDKYLKWNLDDCLIKKCKLNMVNLRKGEKPYYDVVVRVTRVDFVNFDGITTLAHYGISV